MKTKIIAWSSFLRARAVDFEAFTQWKRVLEAYRSTADSEKTRYPARCHGLRGSVARNMSRTVPAIDRMTPTKWVSPFMGSLKHPVSL